MAVRSNTYEKAVKYLEKIYTLINQEYFYGKHADRSGKRQVLRPCVS